MRKISVLVLLSMIINIFSSVIVYGEEKNGAALELVKERIVSIADDVEMSEDDVDRYLSEYDRTNDFVYDLIKYKKYIENNPGKEIAFDDFRNNKYDKAAETMSYASARADVSGTIFMPPEQEERDYRNYTMTNGNERINYATGVLSHEETDFVLPGVNGLDFALTVRFNQEETALGMPGAVPTFDYWDSPTYSTWIFGYTSAAEERCGIGAGWSFAIPYVKKDINERDKYYIRLADGSTLDTENWGRKTKDIDFEVRAKNDYVVTYKNGTKDYFNDKGIIRTEDRYGNSIRYFYADDGLLEKIIDSVNRNIIFERTYHDGTNKAEVNVYVDGKWMCEYKMEKNTDGKYMMYEKATRNSDNLYFYDKNEIDVRAPMAYEGDVTAVFTIDEIVNWADKYSYKYEYEKGNMAVENDYGSVGFREFMKIKNRKTVGTFSCRDEIVYEVNYQYSDYYKYWHIPYEVTETVAQTGLETTYMSNDYYGLIKNKKITAPDSDVKIEIDYSYDKYNLMKSYLQRTYNNQDETAIVAESYEHDEKGNVISHTDKFGTQRKYSYDEATSVVTKIEEPISRYGVADTRYTINTLDEKGNIITSSIADGREDNIVQSVVSTYDTYGNILSRKTVPEYMEEEYFEYTDNHANVKKHMKGDTVIGEYTYDDLGRKISETNSLGQTTQYKYNVQNEVVEIINPDNTNTKNLYSKNIGFVYLSNVYFNEKGPVKKETLDDFDRITAISEISILESQNQYNNKYHYEDMLENDSHFIEALQMPWQETEQIQYDSIGRVIQVSNVNGITKYEYDNFNRVIKQVNPDLSEKRIEYDDINRIRTIYDEEGNKTAEKYDEENRVIEQTIFPEESNLVTQSFRYDRTGNLVEVTDYNGNTTEYSYDVLGRKYHTLDAMGGVSRIQYADDLSYVTEFYTDNTIRQSSYYDEFGRLSAVTDEYFNVNNYIYDTAGNLIESIDKNGDSTRYTYNSRNAVTNIATDAADKLYVYDEAGKVRAVESRKANSQGTLEKDNRIQYNYRVDGRVNAETDFRLDGTSRVTFNTQYNEVGSPTSFTVKKDTGQEIKKTQYTRDGMDRVNDIGQTASGVQNKNVGCEYYANGWLKKETLPNGYSNNYIYDGAGRITELNRLDANGISTLKYNYTYDNNGNRTGIVETDNSGRKVNTAYEYDKLNRLIKEINGHSGNTTTYKFDARNNITEKTVSGTDNYTESYIYTSEHTDNYMSDRIIEVTKKTENTVFNRTYYYQKPNGNTYKKIVTNEYGEPTEMTDYTYNSWNLMDSASVKKGNTKTDVIFKYDATNRRNGKMTEIYENGQLTESKTTEYIWYGDKVQYEEVMQNNTVTPKVNMWGMSGIAARNEELFSSDAHGNTDEGYEGTTTVKRYTYDAYGNAISDTGDDDNPYRYCGENYDEETGLYYLRARYYDPSIGRFMSEDPAQDGLNWYVYCGNNPVMCIDPSGESWKDAGTFINKKMSNLSWCIDILNQYGSNINNRIGVSGFYYAESQGIFYSHVNAWQRDWGYNNFYDSVAETFMNIAHATVYFPYNNRTWRIEFWKGDYGPTIGAEVGVYYNSETISGHYDSVDNDNLLKMSMNLSTKDGEQLFSRSPVDTWWLTGFKIHSDLNPSDLVMRVRIHFKDSYMRNEFQYVLKSLNDDSLTYESVTDTEGIVWWK
ncbi:MAG: DUF4474 domain-containing protein [Clostridia bacterium]|nr:DUF4474 domain-containing protein [Clostridia bacterium]